MDISNLQNANVSGLDVEKRKVALSYLSKLSLVSIGVSVASILLGGFILFRSGGAEFPIIAGAPVWSGAALLLSGMLGYFASISDVHYGSSPPLKVRCLMLSYFISCMTSMGASGLCFAYSAVGATLCLADDDQCGQNAHTEFILNIVSIVVSVFMLTCVVVGSIFFFVYIKILGIYRPMNMLYQNRINDLKSGVI